MSAVLAPFMAAATEEEVGCLWSWGQGAHRLVGGPISSLVPPQCPRLVEMELLGSEDWKTEKVLLLGGRALSKAWAQGRGPSIRGVSGGSLPLGCPGSGFKMGLTSSPSLACPTRALPVRGAVSGQWLKPTCQAFHCPG